MCKPFGLSHCQQESQCGKPHGRGIAASLAYLIYTKFPGRVTCRILGRSFFLVLCRHAAWQMLHCFSLLFSLGCCIWLIWLSSSSIPDTTSSSVKGFWRESIGFHKACHLSSPQPLKLGTSDRQRQKLLISDFEFDLSKAFTFQTGPIVLSWWVILMLQISGGTSCCWDLNTDAADSQKPCYSRL